MAKAKKTQGRIDGAVMTDEGLSYKGFIMDPIVEKCEGCERAVAHEDKKYCPTYAKPAQKWNQGVCNFATHVRAEVTKEGKVKVNPLKASKRAARGR